MMIVMRFTMYRLMTLLGFIALFSCTRKEDSMDGICVDDTKMVKVSASLPELKSPSYVELSKSQIFVHDYVNPEEENHYGTVQERIDADGIYYFRLPSGTDKVMFTNMWSKNYGTNYMFNYMSLTKDFDNHSLVFSRSTDLDSRCDLVAGGASLSSTPEDGIVKVHLNRLISYISANLKAVDPNKNELVLNEYISGASFCVLNQATSISCDIDGNVVISESSADAIQSYSKSGVLCAERPVFPTAQGMTAVIELRLKHYDNKETVLRKELDYSIERNKHYTFNVTVKCNDTAFGGFDIESIVAETIDISLN